MDKPEMKCTSGKINQTGFIACGSSSISVSDMEELKRYEQFRRERHFLTEKVIQIIGIDNAIMFIPDRVLKTELKQLPKTKCWRKSEVSNDKFTLLVNMRTGKRLVEVVELGIFDIGVCY